MSAAPDVSVVMSVYNGADTLRETMESILSQESVSIEFIIINDGSTDKSDVILADYARRDARLRILHQENEGLTRALIKGSQVAKGKYIARQDAGDISMPKRLRLQHDVLDRYENCNLVSCWTSIIGPMGEYLYTIKGKGHAELPVCILSDEEEWGVIDGPTHHGSVMFRKAAYAKAGGYRAAFYYGQDWDLWYRLAARGTFAMVEQSLYRARFTVGSISSSCRDRQSEFARLSRMSLSLRRSGRSDAKVLQVAEGLHPCKSHGTGKSDRGWAMYFIGKCLANNNDPRATHYLLRAISTNPFLLRAWWWAGISLARHPASGFSGSDAN